MLVVMDMESMVSTVGYGSMFEWQEGVRCDDVSVEIRDGMGMMFIWGSCRRVKL
jgi:hypothetical protein